MERAQTPHAGLNAQSLESQPRRARNRRARAAARPDHGEGELALEHRPAALETRCRRRLELRPGAMRAGRAHRQQDETEQDPKQCE
jgi:hypothetical protein